MSTFTRLGALIATAVAVSTLTPPAAPAQAVDTDTPHAAAAMTPEELRSLGKATGSGQYGLIGSDREASNTLYGVTITEDGSIWSANPGYEAFARGIHEYRKGDLDIRGGDYLGGGAFANEGGYLSAGWEPAVRYRNRDSTKADPAGGTEKWAEPRGIEALPGGGVAVNDTNGDASIPTGTIIFYDAEHQRTGNAGVANDEGCTQLASGELKWGPYFAVVGDTMFAPYEGCNVVSAFAVPSGEPLFRLTGETQTAGNLPNPPHPDAPGDLADPYGVAFDGEALITSDLGYGRTTGGAVQRWFVDEATQSWSLDTDFGSGGAAFFPGESIYSTTVDAGRALYVIPSTGPVKKLTPEGEFVGEVSLEGLPSATTRDVAVTPEGWLVMTVRDSIPLRILATSPDPVEGLTAEPGQTAGSISLDWEGVESGYGGAPILDYVIEMSADNGASWELVERDPSLDTAATVRDLAAGDYSFRVSAMSEAGRGDSATVHGIVPAAPEPFISVELTAAAPEVTAVDSPVVWTAVVTNTGNTPLAEVSAEFEHGRRGAAETVAIEDLAPGADATVRVTSRLTQEEVDLLRTLNRVTATGLPPGAERPVTAVSDAELQLVGEVTVDPGPDPGVDPPVGPGPGDNDEGTSKLARSGSGFPLAALGIAALLVMAGAGGALLRARRTH